jgi:hypothetical protein
LLSLSRASPLPYCGSVAPAVAVSPNFTRF